MYNLFISDGRYKAMLQELSPVFSGLVDGSKRFTYLLRAEHKFYPLLTVLGDLGSQDPALSEVIRAVLFHRVVREDNELEFMVIHKALSENLLQRTALLTALVDSPELSIVSPNPHRASLGRACPVDPRPYIHYAVLVSGEDLMDSVYEDTIMYNLFVDKRTWGCDQFWKVGPAEFNELFQKTLNNAIDGDPNWVFSDMFPALPGLNRFDRMCVFDPVIFDTVEELVGVSAGYEQETGSWVPLIHLSELDRKYNSIVSVKRKGV